MNLTSIKYGVYGGLAGGVVFGVMMGMLPMIGSMAGIPTAWAGFLMHMMISATIGATFAVLVEWTSWPSGISTGLGYGALWWILGPLTLMPLLMGMGVGANWNAGAVAQAMPSLMGHLVFGARGAGLGPQEAEDVTQATFATFIERAQDFEGRSRVRTWLFGILSKKIAETRRASQRDRQMDEVDEAFEQRFDATGGWSAPPLPVDVALHHQEIEREIFTCLDAAPIRQALAFILREVEELSTEDICNVLGVTVTNLGVMLHRIRHRVRELPRSQRCPGVTPMPTCKEVARAVGLDEARTGSWTRRLQLQLHLLMCRHCRRYAAQIRAIGLAARSMFREQEEDVQVLERIRERVLNGAEAGAQTHTPDVTRPPSASDVDRNGS